MGDFNQSIYTSDFLKALTGEDLQLEEQYRKFFDQDAPVSHVSGQSPICGVFATPRITVNAAFLAKHDAAGSIRDHRLHVFDLSSTSFLGMDTPTVTKTAVRNLQCNQDYTRVAYCKMLMQLTANHRMFTKVNLLKKNKANLSAAEFMLQYNK